MEEGPFIIGLDRALKSFNVQREAYYGGTFVGNHVHRWVKVNMSLLDAISHSASRLKTSTHCVSLW